jgi:hypothetical protein
MVKAKVFLYIMKHYNMKEHGRKEAKLHGILSAGLEGSSQHHFSPGEIPQYLLASSQRMPGHFEER